MDIQLERDAVVRQVMLVDNVDFLASLKGVLAAFLGQSRQNGHASLEAEDDIPDSVWEDVEAGIRELDAGKSIPHEQIMAEVRQRYKRAVAA